MGRNACRQSQWVERDSEKEICLIGLIADTHLKNIVTIVDVVAVVVSSFQIPSHAAQLHKAHFTKCVKRSKILVFVAHSCTKQEPKTKAKTDIEPNKSVFVCGLNNGSGGSSRQKIECHRNECEGKREEAKWNDVEIVVLMVIGCIDFKCVLAQHTNRYRIGVFGSYSPLLRCHSFNEHVLIVAHSFLSLARSLRLPAVP